MEATAVCSRRILPHVGSTGRSTPPSLLRGSAESPQKPDCVLANYHQLQASAQHLTIGKRLGGSDRHQMLGELGEQESLALNPNA